MKTDFKDKKIAHSLILALVLGLFIYMLAMAYDHSRLRSEVRRIDSILKVSASNVAYAQLSSDFPQRATSNKPTKIQMRLRDAIQGVEFNPTVSTTDIKILHDGVYFLMSRLRAGSPQPACAKFYYTINNRPLDNSVVTLCFPKDDLFDKDVNIAQNMIALHEGDELSVVTENTSDSSGQEAAAEMQPIVPSVVFTMFRLGDIKPNY